MRNTHNDHPLFVITDTIIDDLAAVEVGIPLEHLDRSILCRVKDIPMEDRCIGDQTQAAVTEPFPEDNILVHDRRLQLGLRPEIEDLDGSALCLEGKDLAGEVHDGTVGADSAFDDFIVVLEVYDYDLRLVLFIKFLSYANKVVGL